jgi:hypothetical protein
MKIFPAADATALFPPLFAALSPELEPVDLGRGACGKGRGMLARVRTSPVSLKEGLANTLAVNVAASELTTISSKNLLNNYYYYNLFFDFLKLNFYIIITYYFSRMCFIVKRFMFQ